MKSTVMAPLGSEALGTLFFVFLGAGAVVAVGTNNLGSGLAWALALVVAVWVFSAGGGHLNPFVTIGLALRGRFSWAAVPGHVIAQLVGGLVGALLAWWLYSSPLGDQAAGLAATQTGAEGIQLIGAVAAEALATFVLVAVVFRLIGSGGALYGLGYGLTYGAGVLAIGALTGGSMNFARTLGAELSMTIVGNGSDWANIWIYLVGPLVGVALAWLLYPRLGGAAKSESS
jgi:glycerol uptake facilitator protein